MRRGGIITVILCVFLFALSLVLTGCDFVSYVDTPADTSAAEADLRAVQDTYVAQLEESYPDEYYLIEDMRIIRILRMDAALEIRECRTAEEIPAVYEKHLLRLDGVKTIFAYAEDEIRDYLDITLYREAEQQLIADYIAYYAGEIRETTDVVRMGELLAEYKIKVYTLKTDAVYTAEETVAMRESYIEQLGAGLGAIPYRDEQRKQIWDLIDTYREKYSVADTKEELTELQDAYFVALAEIKTHEQLSEEELSGAHATVIGQMEELLSRVDLSPDVTEVYAARVAEQESAFSTAENRREVMIASVQLQTEIVQACIDSCGADEALIDALRESVTLYITHSYNEWIYRQQEKEQITALIADYAAQIATASEEDTLLQLRDGCLTALARYPTADEAWAADDAAFLATIEETWGENGLARPESLTEATDFYSLASIIDYYAFHQKDGHSFYRDTFRVLIKFEHDVAQQDVNRVFWHCELIRSVVGLTGYYENYTDYLVLRLVPYDIGSITNKVEGEPAVDRYENLVTWGTGEIPGTPRPADYDDFAYKKNTKVLTGIWNTHQLWYAIQYDYLPVCVPGSVAEQTLLKAEEILRQVVTDEMTQKEKIHYIFRWFSENVRYDEEYYKYYTPEDREHFPDSLVALLRSFHAEGPLLEQVSVCCGYAKACMMLLRMEGIDAYRLLLAFQIEDNVLDNNGYNWYGSHEVVVIKTEDGRVMVSDPEQSYIRSDGFLQKMNQMLIPRDLLAAYAWADTRLFPDFEYAREFSPFFENLYYGEHQVLITSEQQVKDILDDFAAETRSEVQISLFRIGADAVDIKALLNEDGRFEYRELEMEKDGLYFKEYVIFK